MHTDKKLIGIIAASALFGGIVGGGIGASLGSFHHGSRGGYSYREGGKMMGGNFENSGRYAGMMNTRSQYGAQTNYNGTMNQNQGTTTK